MKSSLARAHVTSPRDRPRFHRGSWRGHRSARSRNLRDRARWGRPPPSRSRATPTRSRTAGLEARAASLRRVCLVLELVAEHAPERSDALDPRPEPIARATRQAVLADAQSTVFAAGWRRDREQALYAEANVLRIRRLHARLEEELDVTALENHPRSMARLRALRDTSRNPVRASKCGCPIGNRCRSPGEYCCSNKCGGDKLSSCYPARTFAWLRGC